MRALGCDPVVVARALAAPPPITAANTAKTNVFKKDSQKISGAKLLLNALRLNDSLYTLMGFAT